jgi:hypothetical protein
MRAALFLAMLVLWPGAAAAQILSRTDCTQITAPVVGTTLCLDTTAQALKLWTGAWTPISFLTDATGNVWVAPSDNTTFVGLGTATPASRLEVKGAGGDASRIRITATGSSNGAFLRMKSSAAGFAGHEVVEDTDGTFYINDLQTSGRPLMFTAGDGVVFNSTSTTGMAAHDVKIAPQGAILEFENAAGTNVIPALALDANNNMKIVGSGTAVLCVGQATTAACNTANGGEFVFNAQRGFRSEVNAAGSTFYLMRSNSSDQVVIDENAKGTKVGGSLGVGATPNGQTGIVAFASFAFTNIATFLTGNGQIGYCSDCTIANPCAGGGNGAIAKRLNGVNVCN